MWEENTLSEPIQLIESNKHQEKTPKRIRIKSFLNKTQLQLDQNRFGTLFGSAFFTFMATDFVHRSLPIIQVQQSE